MRDNVRRRLIEISIDYPGMRDRDMYRDMTHHMMRWDDYINYLYHHLYERRDNNDVRRMMRRYEEGYDGDYDEISYQFIHNTYPDCEEEEY